MQHFYYKNYLDSQISINRRVNEVVCSRAAIVSIQDRSQKTYPICHAHASEKTDF